jgi:hypothetical protein
MRLAEAIAELHRAEGKRVSITGSHPSLIAHCRHSARWRVTQVRTTGASRHSAFGAHSRTSRGRPVVSFEYQASASEPNARCPPHRHVTPSFAGVESSAQQSRQHR